MWTFRNDLNCVKWDVKPCLNNQSFGIRQIGQGWPT